MITAYIYKEHFNIPKTWLGTYQLRCVPELGHNIGMAGHPPMKVSKVAHEISENDHKVIVIAREIR